MSVTADLVAYLTAYPALAALIGTRCYPQALAGGTILPAMTYQAISGPRDFSHDGPGLAWPRYQLTCFATRYLAAHELAETAQRAMDGWRAAHGFPAFAGDPYDLPGEREAGVYAVAVDVEIWHR